MGQDTLTVKLNELQRQYGQMIRHVEISDEHSLETLQHEIEEAKREYRKNEEFLSEKVLYSKSRASADMAEVYEKISRQYREMRDEYHFLHSEDEREVEESILLAEYALDFAALSVHQALILSLEAIYSEKKQMMKEGEKVS